jgi:hypothetical protein
MRHFCGSFCHYATGHFPEGALPAVSCGQCFWLVICTNTIPRTPAMAVGAHVAHGKRQRRGLYTEGIDFAGNEGGSWGYGLGPHCRSSKILSNVRSKVVDCAFGKPHNRLYPRVKAIRWLPGCHHFSCLHLKCFFRGNIKKKSPLDRALAQRIRVIGRCVRDFGAVTASSMFGWVCGAGAFAVVLPTFILVSRMKITTQQYRGNDHFLSTVSSSRHKTMVGGSLVRVSVCRVGLGVSGATIVSGSCIRPSHSWISHLLTSFLSLSLGISSLFCRVTQCM